MENIMAKHMVDLGKKQEQILARVKDEYGLKDKSQALNYIISEFDEKEDPPLKKSFIKKMLKLEKNAKFKTYTSIQEMEANFKNV